MSQNKYESEQIQAVAVTINTKQYTRLSIVSVYIPPKHLLKKNQYADLVGRYDEQVIIGGYINAKNSVWRARLTNSKGKELHEATLDSIYSYVSNGKPTYWPTDYNKIPDLLDLFFIKNVAINFIKVEEGYGLSSNHSRTVLTLSDKAIYKESTIYLVNGLTNWEHFKSTVENGINLNHSLQTVDEVDNEVQVLMKIIQKATWDSTPIIKK